MQTNATFLDMIPGARAGVSYLMGQVANFQRLPSRFMAIETAAIAAKRVAETRENIGAATKLALAIQAIGRMRSQWTNTSGRLADTLEGLRTVGLGMTPVELGLTAARTATEMTALFKGTDAAEATTYNAAKSVMSPSEVDALRVSAPPGASTIEGVGFAKIGAFILAGVVGWKLLFGRPNRRQRALRS